jgi:putative tryptophan/tyrosine transport system substrate-binding protein
MRRREFMTGFGGAMIAWPLVARAQQKSMPVIGFLGIEPSLPGPVAFNQGLRDLGYTEGRNILIEYRWAVGKPERFPALAAELVALKVDVIMSTGGTLGALAAKQATTNVPIVFGAVGDPVAEGACLHPGAAGRERHRVVQRHQRSGRQVARPAQAGCAGG